MINFLFTVLICICLYKIYQHANILLNYKLGEREAFKTLVFVGILSGIMIVLTGDEFWGIACALSALAAWGVKTLAEKSLVHQYMYSYCMSKNSTVCDEIIRKCNITMENVMKMASPEVKKDIQRAIEQEEKEYKALMGECNEE